PHQRRPADRLAVQHAPERWAPAHPDQLARPGLDRCRPQPGRGRLALLRAHRRRGPPLLHRDLLRLPAGRRRLEGTRRLLMGAPTGTTRLAAVIGAPVRHSLSPVLLNAAFRAADLDWVYVALEVSDGEVPAALTGM